jgi:predicted nucleic acid-binding protein
MSLNYCVCHYLDASALAKLISDEVSEEPGRDVLRNYYGLHGANMYATPYCIAETFAAFKRKCFSKDKTISEQEYVEYLQKFINLFLGANLREDQVSLLAPDMFAETERLVKQHGIDFVDALQVVTVMHGQFACHGTESDSILITADKGLAEAARKEGARVWKCDTEPAPVTVVE